MGTGAMQPRCADCQVGPRQARHAKISRYCRRRPPIRRDLMHLEDSAEGSPAAVRGRRRPSRSLRPAASGPVDPAARLTVERLRTEYAENPLGIDVPRPPPRVDPPVRPARPASDRLPGPGGRLPCKPGVRHARPLGLRTGPVGRFHPGALPGPAAVLVHPGVLAGADLGRRRQAVTMEQPGLVGDGHHAAVGLAGPLDRAPASAPMAPIRCFARSSCSPRRWCASRLRGRPGQLRAVPERPPGGHAGARPGLHRLPAPGAVLHL